MENYTFCSRCGRTLPLPEGEERVPFECDACRKRSWQVTDPRQPRPMGASREGDLLYVVTYPGDLGPVHRSRSIDRWPERAFIALSEGYETHFVVTRWIFRREMEPAIRRILWAIRRTLVVVEAADEAP